MEEDFDISKVRSVSWKEMMNEHEEWIKNRFWLLRWVDTWFGGSLAGYRVTHSLSHPHLIIEEWSRQIKWAWQRVFRGWDDRVCWSIDYWLDGIMPDILRQYKEVNQGTPLFCFDNFEHDENYGYSKDEDKMARNGWNDIIDKMIEGFEASKRLDDLEIETTIEDYKIEYERLEKIRKEGMGLFVEYYNSLWD